MKAGRRRSSLRRKAGASMHPSAPGWPAAAATRVASRDIPEGGHDLRRILPSDVRQEHRTVNPLEQQGHELFLQKVDLVADRRGVTTSSSAASAKGSETGGGLQMLELP